MEEEEGERNVMAEPPESKVVGLRFWEAAAASTVLLGFGLGLLSVYLTMPDSDYSFLKLPRSLEDLQVLRGHLENYTSDLIVRIINYQAKVLPGPDDHAAMIGSSNINDRSLLGSRDSKIGVVIEDKEYVNSSMDGKPWKAGKLSYSLRCSLCSEHLGLNTGHVADTTYKDLWSATAKENTRIYHEVFSCIPNDQIYSRAALRQNMATRSRIYLQLECRSQRTWDCSLHTEQDMEAIWLRKQEAIIKRERMKQYSQRNMVIPRKSS